MRALETVREKGTGAGDGSYSHRKHIGLAIGQTDRKTALQGIRIPSAYYTQGRRSKSISFHRDNCVQIQKAVVLGTDRRMPPAE